MSLDLSVVIPTFKRTDSLERLLTLLKQQSGVTLEIIVVDQNGEGYFGGKLLAALQTVKWVKQPVPNASTARNNGFLQAEAPYVLFIDDDLVPDPDFCMKGLQIFKSYPDIKCFVPLVYAHDGKEAAFQSGRNKFLADHPAGNNIFLITETISACIFFDRSYYKATGGFDELLFGFARTSEDQEFFLRMKNKGMKLWLVPSIELFHDEKVGGGCELRTAGYWNTRLKCIRALALRHRIHKAGPGKLSMGDYARLCRFSFLNRQTLTSGPANLYKEVQLMLQGIKESKQFYVENRSVYQQKNVDFLNMHAKNSALAGG